MAEKHITPLWTIANRIVMREPTPKIPPVFWSYQRDVRPYILEAAEIITAAEAHRRVLVLNNPTLKHGATHTLTCAIQAIKGGEVAPAHRHSQAALRFVIEGEGAYTAVNGERIYMHPGDFIVTPAWTWHDHGKDSEGVMIWLDGLDVPLVNHLGATFSDDYEGEGAFPQSRPPHELVLALRLRHVTAGADHAPHSPVFAYPYERTRTALENMRKANDWDACHGLKLKFANPATGDWVMPTIATFAQLLPKGFKTAPYRSTEATVVMVAEGRARRPSATRPTRCKSTTSSWRRTGPGGRSRRKTISSCSATPTVRRWKSSTSGASSAPTVSQDGVKGLRLKRRRPDNI